MGFTLPEALKRARNPMMMGIMKEIVTTDELAAMIPFVPVEGESVSYHREGTLPNTEFIPDSGATTEESTGEDDKVTVPFRRIVGNIDIDAFADDLTGAQPGQQTNLQLAKKAKTTWRKIKDKLVSGKHVTSATFNPATDPFAALTFVQGSAWLDSSRYGPGSVKYTHSGTKWQFRAPGDVQYGEAVTVSTDTTSVVLRSWNRSKYIVVDVDVSKATGDGEAHVTFASSSN